MQEEKQVIQEENAVKEELVKDIIEKLLEQKDRLNVAYHWGEESILLCDVINVINNVAGTDYKRYDAYSSRLDYKENKPSHVHPKCFLCRNFWRNKEKQQGCLGIKIMDSKNLNKQTDPCENFQDHNN